MIETKVKKQQQEGKTKGKNEAEKGLKGILWDLLRLQVKISMTAFGITILLIMAVQVMLPEYFRPWSGSESAGILLATPTAYLSLLILFFLSYLGTAWGFTYSYGAGLKRTITSLIHQLKQFQRGNFRQQIEVKRNDELRKLAEQINGLTLDLEQQIVSMRRVLNENAKLISEAELAASLDERRKLARDLHDAVSQELFAVSMSLGALPRLLDANPEKAKIVFKQSEKMVHHAQQELRALIMHLRPVTLEGKALSQAIGDVMEELKRKHPHLQVDYALGDIPLLDAGAEEQLFRVIQEGISNALRHGNPDKISLRASCNTERLLLILEDDGIGFDMEKQKEKHDASYGLRTMRERIGELGGHFEILTYPNKGTKLEFRIPMVAGKEEEKDE
ncbi:two-component system, NarL family, sensor histidine kinase LiaS [Evansella caseinilytica]|uniref:histidine kinase n=1 Tax=Evansella caseinilytica TaxID=1503961 RepID=A0A1H3PIM4_9BACI|nr:histidine kinase [Evansella caseinilytica]SDZ01002.1 two-component system, NarL family, sensor histidine kinase LiaS [Evansella caseinilytica]